MSLSPNTTLGHYTIISKIGAGGMGEVYRARDTRLDREVAIKVLIAEVSSDSDRLKRFEQEARATSALNHPNILTVYDIGMNNGSPYIVAELLEGEELRQRLDEGPIALRQTIHYAHQIISGLSAAHEKGIVHRDLKPENLFITKDDRVKILDFGLAKLRPPKLEASSSEDATRRAMTNRGVVMGTVGYMSPEQVRGQATDYRSDIFSFGVILHEMITGRRAFKRETVAETMSAILKEEPEELTQSNPNVSPALDRIVRRCIEKKADRRFQSTSDLGFALESLSAPTSSSGSSLTTVATAVAAPSRPGLWKILAVTAILAAAAFILGRRTGTTPPQPSYQRLTFSRERLLESPSMCFPTSWSPDGKFLIYRTVDPQRGRDLWSLPLLGDREPQPLLQTKASEQYGRVSPDGNWLAYESDESGSFEVYVTQFPQPARSWRISTSGGRQPRWRADGKELFLSQAIS